MARRVRMALDGSTDAMLLADAAARTVICAQAFHWFATPSTVAEIARVLQPGGTLALVWNVRDESVPWVRALTEIIQPHEGDVPRYLKGDWRRVFPAPGFGPLQETVFEHAHVETAEQMIVDRFLSVSLIAALPASERADVERRLRALIDADPALAGGKTIALPDRTTAFRCIRQP